MSKDYITNNPVVRMNTLRVATKKFKGYIAGYGDNNKLSLFVSDKELKSIVSGGEQAVENNQAEDIEFKQQEAVEDILNVILDTSSGAYLTKDYLQESKLYAHIDEIGKFTDETVSGYSKALGYSFKILSQDEFFNKIKNPLFLVSPENFDNKTIAASSVFPFQDVTKDGSGNIRKYIFTPTEPEPVETPAEELTDEQKKQIENEKKVDNLNAKYNKFTFAALEEDKQKKLVEEAGISVADFKKILDDKEKKRLAQEKEISDTIVARSNSKFERESTKRANIQDFIMESIITTGLKTGPLGIPTLTNTRNNTTLPIKNYEADKKINSNFSMSSYIFCNQNIQRASKNKDFLNVFFNAIPNIEMSRCTPFLDITIYHKNSSKNNKKFLNQEFHMRFLKQENGEFVLADDSITNATRVGSDPRESGLDTSYMSVFTSPQTMANANINNSNDNIFNNFSRNETNTLGDQRFLEPIVPLMSLASFQVTIDGMGYGMLSSRKGSMSLILHDRSRLSDFAPLVSLNQLVSTSVRVEFGWSHPDGDPIKSDNDIGKFLNCLRDVQYYNLTGTNLKFNNNSVNVEVQLASAGTGIKKAVSAAAGYYAPLSYASNKINKLINDIIDDESLKNGNGDKKKQEGILKKINLFRSSATSQSAVIKSENYKKILSEIDNPNITNSQKLITIAKTLGLLNRQNQVSNNSDIKTVIDSLYDTNFLTEVSRNQSVFTGRVIRDKLAVARYTPDFDLSETTRSKFQEKISGDKNNSDFKNALGDLGLEFIETISFGKLVLMYCGAPMLSTGEFAEVQVCFYPINNKAGGARRFTTASLPIEYSVVRNAIDERFKSDGNISVKGMFQLLANLFEDTGMPVYGAGKFDYEKEIEERTKADPNKLKQEQENAINTWKTNNVPKLTPEEEAKKENKDLTEAQKEAIFKEHLRKEFNKGRADKLEEIYKYDNLPMESKEIIVTPNLQMHMEVLPVIDPSVSTKGSNSIDEFFFGAIKSKEEQGYRDDKKILRIHVYDTRSNGNATGEFLNKVLNEDVADYLVGNIPKGGSKLVRVQKDSIETNGSRLISKIPTRELKEFVKRNYPNITYGAASSVVKNLSISASTRDEYSNLIMIRRKADERAAGGNKNRLSAEEEVAIYPSPYSLEILGCPFIDRGTQIFIDTGTGTDLDNVFTVNSITHTVRSGEFTTSLNLVLTFQGAVSSTRKKLANKLKTAAKEIKKNTDAKQTEQK